MLVSQVDDAGARRAYPVIDGIPVLIDFENSVVSQSSIEKNFETSSVDRKRYSGLAKFAKRLLSPEKGTTKRNVSRILELIGQKDGLAQVLIIGGGTIGQGMAPLYEEPNAKIFSFDLYRSEFNQFIADAHQIPTSDEVFDAVVIQAVLEHTLMPEGVVSEIWRVLKPGGLVYAETPFMQQVHEGAFDFTRFTESGHRFLFRRFSQIDSGTSAGPGTQLIWAIDYFARGLLRSRMAGKMAKLAFFWLRYFDALIPEPYAIDGASGVFFLGAKSDCTMTPHEAVQHYKGAM